MLASRTNRQRGVPSSARKLMTGVIACVLGMSLLFPTSAGAAGLSGQSGKTIAANPLLGPLSARWWQWLAQQPASSNPALSETGENCGVVQPPGRIFFLAGTFVGPVERTECTVPFGKAIFFPIVNIATVKTEDEETARDLWEDIKIDAGWKVTSAEAWVDDIPVPGLTAQNPLYRGCAGPDWGCAPRSFTIDLPDKNIFNVDNPRYGLTVADGFYALIPPLPRGEHSIRWAGSAKYGAGSFTQSVTYHIVVS